MCVPIFSNADVESQDIDSLTPLLTAVSHGCKEAIDILLQKGASADAIDRDGRSMIFKAAEENRHEVLKVPPYTHTIAIHIYA